MARQDMHEDRKLMGDEEFDPVILLVSEPLTPKEVEKRIMEACNALDTDNFGEDEGIEDEEEAWLNCVPEPFKGRPDKFCGRAPKEFGPYVENVIKTAEYCQSLCHGLGPGSEPNIYDYVFYEIRPLAVFLRELVFTLCGSWITLSWD